MSSSSYRWIAFHIPEMDCPQELGLIEKGLASRDGIAQLKANYLGRQLRVEYDPLRTDPDRIGGHLAEIGFPPHDAIHATQGETSWLTLVWQSPATCVATLLWLATIALTLYPTPAKWWVPTAAIAVVFVAGRRVFQKALRSLRLRQLDMHALMCLAVTGALMTSEWLEAATVMVLFRVSLLIEQGSHQRTQRAIHAMLRLTPDQAERYLPDGQTTESVRVDQLTVGDQVLVRPGQRIPTDGHVVDGVSSVDEAAITGESVPAEKQPGDVVYAGTLCGEGSLSIYVQRVAQDSTLSRIAQLVEQARSQPMKLERMVDRFARWYTPAVILLGCLVAFVPPVVAWATPDRLDVGQTLADVTRTWFFRGLVVLVVACPCALVISTPVTVVCGLYRATKLGILVKGAVFLEQIGRLRAAAFDKTGTVTRGRPQVVAVETLGKTSIDDVLRLAATLEQKSEHPLARAISGATTTGLLKCDDFDVLRGFGVRGTVDQQRYLVASPQYFRNQQALSADELERLSRLHEGTTLAILARDEPGAGLKCEGVICLRDEPRESAQPAIQRMRQLGVSRIVMLTGDHQAAAQPLAEKLGFDECYANLLPEDKIVHVELMSSQEKHMAMIGDGVNDTPALAAAPIGIALGTAASDVALETADVAILSPDLGRIADLMILSRRVRRTLATNIALAIGIKLAVLGAALGGYASMWMAVAADVGASLIVIANGMRILRK